MGPYSLDQACQMLVEGKLHTWDLCWPDGAREWIALDSIPTIADKAIAIRDQRRAEALASAQAAASTSPNAPNPQFVDLQPDDQIIPKGQQIGLMIFSSDQDFTLWPVPGTELTIDLDATSLMLPIVGGERAWQDALRDDEKETNQKATPGDQGR